MILKNKPLRMTAEDFLDECGKFGWNDGSDYPLNIEEAWTKCAEILGLEKILVTDSARNKYRFMELEEGHVYLNPNNSNEVINLVWHGELSTIERS